MTEIKAFKAFNHDFTCRDYQYEVGKTKLAIENNDTDLSDNGGVSAQIGSSGDYARISSEGKKAVIACAGINARAKAKIGAWIAIPEFNNDGDCIGFVTGCIGQDGLEEGVFYIAKNGKLDSPTSLPDMSSCRKSRQRR